MLIPTSALIPTLALTSSPVLIPSGALILSLALFLRPELILSSGLWEILETYKHRGQDRVRRVTETENT